MNIDTVNELLTSFTFLADKQNVIEDSHGNVSVKSDDQTVFWIKPSGMAYSDKSIEPIHVPAVKLADGTQCNPYGLRPSVDTSHHRRIYQRHDWVKAICHTHSPYATACAILQKSLAVRCTEHADYFGHAIDCLPYMDLDSWSDFTMDRGVGAVLLGSHGVLTVSEKGPLHAAKLAVALESIAKKYVIARQISELPDPMHPHEVQKWYERYTNSYGQ